MTRLPPALMPLWPAAKRAHRAATRWGGAVGRRLPEHERAVPHDAPATSALTAAAEPDAVVVHTVGPATHVERDVPVGTPGGLRFWDEVRRLDRPDRHVVEVRGGRLVGESAATITPGGRLDLDTSHYFGTRHWHEHPVFLRPRLPRTEPVRGTVLSLASHASARNYYHSLMDALPRWGLFREAFPDLTPDRVVVGHTTRWDRQLVAMVGLADLPLVEPTAGLALQAERLLVPAVDNQSTLAPPWVTRWLRENLRPERTSGRPRRLYVSRGDRPNTRRYLQERELLAALEPQGFVAIDPGTLTVQEQIDHFAAAEVVVAPHGAGLVNLNFAPEGVRVLELFAPTYLNPGYWAITDNVPGSVYRYLVADPVDPQRPERRMTGVQDDVDLDPARVLEALDDLLAASPPARSHP
ncbi:MAG: glycosyltransferase family 61 protein [Aeromicrobium erythreum]